MEDLKIRKEVCELLGWKVVSSVVYANRNLWMIVPSEGMADDGYISEETAWRYCPAIESDPKVSEETLDRVCKEKSWRWEVGNNHDGTKWCWLYRAEETVEEDLDVMVDNEPTASLARAKALISALRGQ